MRTALLLLLDLGAPACGATSEQPPPAASMHTAAGATAAAPNIAAITSCSGELPVMRAFDKAVDSDVEADWSCYDGKASAASNTRRAALFRLSYAPGGTIAAPGIPVDFYFGDSTLGPPAVSGVTDPMMGSVALDLPAGVQRVSVVEHAHKDESGKNLDTYESREYDLPVVDGIVAGTSYIEAGVNILPANVIGPGASIDVTKAYLVATVRDCAGRSVSGAQFELLDDQEVLGDSQSKQPGVAHPIYSQFALPSATCTFTSLQDGAWAMLYAPPNIRDSDKNRSYKLRVKGRKRASDLEPVTLVERELELFAGTLISVHMYKLTQH